MGVVDAHQHVWDLSRGGYGWLGPDLSPINRSFTLEEVAAEQDAAGVTACVLVQADDTADDTQLMLEVARAHPRVVGVVGHVPLERPEIAAAQLAAWHDEPLLVGVRNLIHDRADADHLIRPEVDEGLGLLAAAGIPFDLVSVLPRHLEILPSVLERHPDLKVVIDHLSKPPVGEASLEPWWSLIGEVATHPQVFAKVSGLYPGDDPLAWTVDDLRPVVERAYEVFGPDRLMYGGDWPVSLLAGGYTRVWEALSSLFAEWSQADREAVLHGTATRFYALDPDRLARAGTAAG